MTRKTALWLLLVVMLLPFIYFGAAGAAYLYRSRASNAAARPQGIAPFPPITSASRILVFAPHPDDEALGCAGLIREAVQAGAYVRVVVFTNGDAFRVAVERQYRRLRVGPRDYIAFGTLRQAETRAAMRALGVPAANVTFLGYPDEGLMHLWQTCWSPDEPWTSHYTQLSAVPSAVDYHDGAAYCGQNVLDDVRSILRETRPTEVFVTHLSDDHPDHAAAGAFVTLACQEAAASGGLDAKPPRLYYYLVHRGDWPVPRGLLRSLPLNPPVEMTNLGTRWFALPLTSDALARKVSCIRAYRSQMAMMRSFLLSFARRNELFGQLPESTVPLASASPMPPALVTDRERWAVACPAIRDPINDSLLRDFQAGGDIETVYAYRDATTLHLQIDTHRRLGRGVSFALHMRYFGASSADQAGGTLDYSILPPRRAQPAGVQFTASGRSLDVDVPLRDIAYAPTVALDVDTHLAGLEIDTTGYRFLRL